SRYIAQDDVMHWEMAPFNPGILSQKGFQVALSGDGVEKPKDLFKAIQKVVKSGFPKDSALAALTLVPARLVNAQKRIGKIESGYMANFFVASADVFTDEDAKI